ncbi:YqgQ family protein [Mammaliicoccus sciuri]|uniref:YqgQ family protein n=1 Tax=Mammaliicoccus sciuri TaxID=1296 RepID=UPI00194DB9EB|nr:YqgQ family protein [Mammaliicoccus sciuri]
MNNLYDVQQVLKKFGYIIYFKDEEDQLEMMEQEIKAMYQSMLIDKETFLQARLIINQRRIEKK